MRDRGWVGFDLDGTLAKYDHWLGCEHVGDPILPMVERVKAKIAEGYEVRIVTARASAWEFEAIRNGDIEDVRYADNLRELSQITKTSLYPLNYRLRHSEMQEMLYKRDILPIVQWCEKHIGQKLRVTAFKDYRMVALYDDRCVQVVPNTGELVQDLGKKKEDYDAEACL